MGKEQGIEMGKEINKTPGLGSYNSYVVFKGNLTTVLGFSEQVVATTFDEGANALMQTCGIGRLRPNIAVLAFPNEWSRMIRKKRSSFINVVHKAVQLRRGIMITANFPTSWDLMANLPRKVGKKNEKAEEKTVAKNDRFGTILFYLIQLRRRYASCCFLILLAFLLLMR